MRVVDLFAGAGGMSLGATFAGLDVVAAFDHWTPAVQTYGANFSHSVFQADLSEVGSVSSRVQSFSPDIITGGPPCQDFSDAGSRVEGSRAELTSAFAEIVTRVAPRAFIMENVPAALRSNAYANARSIFKEHGYGLTELVLDASYFGVPQRRKRLFVIGIANTADDDLAHAVADQQTLFPLSVIAGIPSISLEHYYRHPRSYTRRGVFSVSEPSPTIRGTNRPRPSTYVPHPNDTSRSSSVRSLTSVERALVQTFPSDFTWLGSQSEVEQMIGNAVPPELARRIFTSVVHFLHSDAPSTRDNNGGSIALLKPSLLTLVRRVERQVPHLHTETHEQYLDRILNSEITSLKSEGAQLRVAEVLNRNYYTNLGSTKRSK